MKCSLKLLAAVAAAAVVVSSVEAKPGSGKGPSGGHANSGGPTMNRSLGSIRTQQPQFQQQHFVKQNVHVDRKFDHVVRHDRVVLNHVQSGFKYSIAHCPTKSYQKCDFGYCFHGKACSHWEYRCWAPTYGCYLYYCPYTYCEYWFCLEDDCYYPVGYCPVAYRVKYKFGW
jgi:hypothetical protein